MLGCTKSSKCLWMSSSSHRHSISDCVSLQSLLQDFENSQQFILIRFISTLLPNSSQIYVWYLYSHLFPTFHLSPLFNSRQSSVCDAHMLIGVGLSTEAWLTHQRPYPKERGPTKEASDVALLEKFFIWCGQNLAQKQNLRVRPCLSLLRAW